MIRKEIMRRCFMEACRNQPQALIGVLDYLLIECQISPERLVDIAERQFGIPRPAAWGALYDLHPGAIQ